MGSHIPSVRLSCQVADIIEAMILGQCHEVVIAATASEASAWAGDEGLVASAWLTEEQAAWAFQHAAESPAELARGCTNDGLCSAVGRWALVDDPDRTRLAHKPELVLERTDPRLRVVGMVTAPELLRWAVTAATNRQTRGLQSQAAAIVA